MPKKMNARVLMKNDLATNWESATGFTPKLGEVIVYNADSVHPTPRIKIGNDTDNVNSLPFAVSNDFTDEAKTKLAGIATGAEVNQNAFSKVQVGSTTIIAENKTDTLTMVSGSNVTITPDANNDKITISATDTVYTHPTYTGRDKKLYKVAVDTTGHVNDVTEVTKADITDLGIPGALQNAFSSIKVGDTTVAADTATDSLTLVAGSNVTITPDTENDKITISATDTVYTHPSHTAKNSGLYKITVDNKGHVSGATAVAKSDITGLGIPGALQNAFKTISVTNSSGTSKGNVVADDVQDTLTIKEGANITITPTSSSDTIQISATDTVYTHPTHTAAPSGLYKVTVDNLGHVTETTAVSKSDITSLGIPALDDTGKVPSTQLPSYVDDVLEYASKTNFPTSGEAGKIYVDTTTNKTYRWGGTTYVEISQSLAIGTTESTAAAGNHTHSVTHKPAGTIANTSITPKGTVTSTFTGTAKTHTHTFTGTPAAHGHTFTGTEATIATTYTPAGTVNNTFTGSAATSGGPSKTATVASSTHTHKYTPTGTVSKPTFTGSETNTGAAVGTTTVYSITGVGTLPSHTYTAPSLTASVTNRCLTLSFNAGSHTFDAGSLPTKGSGVTVATGAHTHKVTATGTVSQPTFTGTEASTTSISGTTTVADSTHTHSVTAKGSVASTFTGTEATISSDYTPEGSISNTSLTPAGSVADTSITPEGTIASTFTGTAASHKHTFTGTEATLTTSTAK